MGCGPSSPAPADAPGAPMALRVPAPAAGAGALRTSTLLRTSSLLRTNSLRSASHTGAGSGSTTGSCSSSGTDSAELSSSEYAMAVLLTPELRAPFDAFLAGLPAHSSAAASVAFIDALDRVRADLEQGVTTTREVCDASGPGPFEESAWVLVEDAIARFRRSASGGASGGGASGGSSGSSTLEELRSVEDSVVLASNEVRMLSNAYTAERPKGGAGPATWVRACPIEPDAALEHISAAKRTAVRILAGFALQHYARSAEGQAQERALRQGGYHEPVGLLGNASARLVAGDKLADILARLARGGESAGAEPVAGDSAEAACALRRAAWLKRFKALVDGLSTMVSITDMSKKGSPLIYANAAFLKGTGFSAEDVKGRSATAEQALRHLGACIREGREGATEVVNYRRDGSSFLSYMCVKPVSELVPQQGEAAAQWRVAFYVGLLMDVRKKDDPTRVLKLEALLKSLPARIE